jgi:hypothetical protein
MKNIFVISYKEMSNIVYHKLHLGHLENFKIHFIVFQGCVSKLYKGDYKNLKLRNIIFYKTKSIKKIKKLVKVKKPNFIICYFIEEIERKYLNLYYFLNTLSVPKIKILEPNFVDRKEFLIRKLKNFFFIKKFIYDYGVFESKSTESHFYYHKFKNKIYYANNNYFNFINENKKKNKEKIVFLDENLIFHPDINITKLKKIISKKKYYSTLKIFFRFLQKKMKKKIYIANHPTTKKNYFVKFKNMTNKTNNLVANASLVIMHQSSAIDFAILNKKKILFTYFEDMKNSQIKNNIFRFAKFFKSNPVNLSLNLDFLNISRSIVNPSSLYDKFINLYIKHPKYNGENLAKKFTKLT